MPAVKPNQGPVLVSQSPQPISDGQGHIIGGGPAKKPRPDGSTRPNIPFRGEYGLRICVRREPGLTSHRMLSIPLRFQCPVTNNFARPYQFYWASWDSISAGQRSRPQGKQLLALQLDTLLMDDVAADASSHLVVCDTNDPQGTLDELLAIMGTPRNGRVREPTIFRVVIDQPAIWRAPVVNMLAVLTAVTPTQNSGEPGSEYLTLTFQEYPEDENPLQRSQRPQKHATRSHKLTPKDTLYELAKRFFHKPSDWKQIAKANGITGVAPGSASELAAWAKRHHRTNLKIPAYTLASRSSTTTARLSA